MLTRVFLYRVVDLGLHIHFWYCIAFTACNLWDLAGVTRTEVHVMSCEPFRIKK